MFISIPIALIAAMLRVENKIVNGIGVIVAIGFFALCFYMCLASAALMGLDRSN